MGRKQKERGEDFNVGRQSQWSTVRVSTVITTSEMIRQSMLKVYKYHWLPRLGVILKVANAILQAHNSATFTFWS